MVKLKPWGHIDWLMPKLNISDWHIITCASFEDRCSAVSEWLISEKQNLKSSFILQINNPLSDNWLAAKDKVNENFSRLMASLSGPKCVSENVGLLDGPRPIAIQAIDSSSSDSVILDISTFPKRYFFYIFRQLMQSDKIQNVLVTYSKAASYPELALCENALPPGPMNGFARTVTNDLSTRFIISVGYVALSIEALMEDVKSSKLDFLFPFPPASPAYRRNWALLSLLMPEDFPSSTEIHRIDGMDAFEVCSRIEAWGRAFALNLIPLGPKPHALGMAMAHMKLNGKTEIIYAQPTSYLPNYSIGVGKNGNGRADIIAYCTKWRGKYTF